MKYCKPRKLGEAAPEDSSLPMAGMDYNTDAFIITFCVRDGDKRSKVGKLILSPGEAEFLCKALALYQEQLAMLVKQR